MSSVSGVCVLPEDELCITALLGRYVPMYSAVSVCAHAGQIHLPNDGVASFNIIRSDIINYFMNIVI